MAKILIVDDSAYARRVHRAMLEQAGYDVVEASTGIGAIELFALEQPDAVLLDLSMADMNGADVLRTLRELDSQARVIVVSADIQRTTEQSVMALGAERFLAKPAKADQLVATITDVLGAPRS
jgi:two-component system, chemotaxis family, chemotaxis protein CheY